MKVVETFAGCGGSSLGWAMAGCKVLAAVEWEDHAAQCYRLNHPSTVLLHRDIATVTGAEIMEATGLAVGELDVLSGSPPCQGFSTAGQRLVDDPRNSLFRHHLRLVDELQPRHVTIENVEGMTTGKMAPVAQEIVRELRHRGYQVVAGILDAQYLGVPQRRRRVFFIGSRSRAGLPVLPAPFSRPVPAGVALRNVVPDEILMPTHPVGRVILRGIRPGECGADVMERLGRGRNYWSDRMLHPNKVCPTIVKTADNKLAMLHWERRHLSVREALVLTGFPPDYILPGSFAERWARVGNSVAPPVMAAVARSLLALDAANGGR